MANWTNLVKAGGTQPVVIGSVNSFWILGLPEYQGNIRTEVTVTSVFAQYETLSVSPLLNISENNVPLFLGFEGEDLKNSFQIRNDNTLLPHEGTLQQLLKRDEGKTSNTLITLYVPRIDMQPIGQVGLVEAYAVEFDNNILGDPGSTAAQAAILSLTSRMYNYGVMAGPMFDGTWANDITDQSTGFFSYGGVMTIADGTTGNNPVLVIPQ